MSRHGQEPDESPEGPTVAPDRPPSQPFAGFDLDGRAVYDYGPGYESLGGAKR